jgi:hypothetical protein
MSATFSRIFLRLTARPPSRWPAGMTAQEIRRTRPDWELFRDGRPPEEALAHLGARRILGYHVDLCDLRPREQSDVN